MTDSPTNLDKSIKNNPNKIDSSKNYHHDQDQGDLEDSNQKIHQSDKINLKLPSSNLPPFSINSNSNSNSNSNLNQVKPQSQLLSHSHPQSNTQTNNFIQNSPNRSSRNDSLFKIDKKPQINNMSSSNPHQNLSPASSFYHSPSSLNQSTHSINSNSLKKRGFFGILRKKPSRADLSNDQINQNFSPTTNFPEELMHSSSKIKNLTGLTDHDLNHLNHHHHHHQQQHHHQLHHNLNFQSISSNQSTNLNQSSPSSHPNSNTKRQRIRKFTNVNTSLGLKDKNLKSDQLNHFNPTLSSPIQQQNHLITLDTNLDQMDGIINSDRMLQLRRTSSMSGIINSNLPSTDFHSSNSPLLSSDGQTTLFADPFNPGRTLSPSNYRHRNGSASTYDDGSLNSFQTNHKLHQLHRQNPSLSNSSVRDLFSQNLQPRRTSQASQSSHNSLPRSNSQSFPNDSSLSHSYSNLNSNNHIPSSTAIMTTSNPLNNTNAPISSANPLNTLNSLGGTTAPAGWIAPESWAVNPLDGYDQADSDADESQDDQDLLASEIFNSHPDHPISLSELNRPPPSARFPRGNHPNGSFSGVSGTTTHSIGSTPSTSISGSLYSSATVPGTTTTSHSALLISQPSRLGSIDEGPSKTNGLNTPLFGPSTGINSRRPSDSGGMSIINGSDGVGPNPRTLGSINTSGSILNGKLGPNPRNLPLDGSKSWTIRVSRSDGSFATLSCPLTFTTSEICQQLGKKLFNQKPPSSYKLYIKERGLERIIGPNEKPLMFQRRRLEQAGYTAADRLDDVGRLDYSYLIKFLYKEESLTVASVDEDFHDCYEFVDLQAKSIQAIPIVLFNRAPLIVSLNLSRNPKLDIPSDFIQLCTSLRELKICHMGIKRVQPSIRQCYSLFKLDISNNRIIDLEQPRLDDLLELTALKAHNNRLWTLPDYFHTFKTLRLLNISNNKFETLPSVICQIESLVDLDISFNMITSLPNEIGQLTKLERFVFLANPISTIPNTFNGLIQLSELDCRRCLLGDIAIFSDLPKLKKLLCENNAATILDGTFNSLQELNAAYNSITRLLLVGTGATLVSLNVSHAKISSLSQEFFDALVSCESLNLDSNQIKSFSDSFSQLTNLRNFSMKNNHLTTLPDSIGQLQRLHTLDLANNNLNSLPKTIWNCSQLIVLNVSSNLLQEFPMPPAISSNNDQTLEDAQTKSIVNSSLPSLKTTTTHYQNNLNHSTSNIKTRLPLAKSLQELFLGDNGLCDSVFNSIILLSELRVLNLSFNDLYEIPIGSLNKFESLEELYLSGNSLTSLQGEDFENLINLKTLFLNGNKLQTLPAELGKLKHLENLDVSSNLLKYNVTNWPYDWNWNWNLDLQYLNLSGNKRLEIKPSTGAQQDAVALAKRKNLCNFNALRRLRVLGLMDVTLTTPSVPDESEDRRVRVTQSEVSSMGYGIADSMGREDFNVIGLDMVVSRFRNRDDESLFGLFDSHSKTPFGGGKLAKFLHDGFSISLNNELKRLKENEGIAEALRRSFLNINRDYGNLITNQFETRRKGSGVSLHRSERPSITSVTNGVDLRCGASAVVMYVVKKTIYVANVGDALAVIAKRGGAALPLASKHDPFDVTEIERIRSAEGWVSQKGLVADEVEVSRSFGYFHVHPAINARPSIHTLDLSEDDEFIIIANAGLWSHMTYQAAVDVARAQNRKADPMIAAQKLRDLALSYGAESNLMVMVIALGDLFKAKRRLTYRGIGGVQFDEELYGNTRVTTRRGQLLDAPGEKYLTLLDQEVAPPTGMVALVFTDIRNSTSLWETNPGMQSAMRMHNQLLRRQLRAIGGYEVKTEGDAFMVSFPSVTSALLWCFTVQLELLREDWPQEILDSEDGKEIYDSNGMLCYRGLSVRMGIHWGNPHCEADPITRRMDYFGPMVNRSARISGEAKGGEITASLDVIEIVKTLCFDNNDEKDGVDSLINETDTILDPATRRDVASIRKIGFGISEIGEKRLKGLEMPEFLSLIYPRALAGRLKNQGASLGGPDSKVDEVYEPTPRILDVNHIRQLGMLVMRLEAVSAANVHTPINIDSLTSPNPNHQNQIQELEKEKDEVVEERIKNQKDQSKRKFKLLQPHLVNYPIRFESTDEELFSILENQIIRIENVISSLELKSLGPIYDVLLALSDAIKLEPNIILHALETFGIANDKNKNNNSIGMF
ncbi:hypothetical protein O181_038711 [Austropuccinia psidii MF-1]|uniref:Adenylate cyclase n=1 Tax=Austropuccinia psidii MF-1 TaxID=1389203 RepID=A0A9Q3DEH8_9BASI|nr:hypothetical protein [Austropuccinia psidii MF-1]